MTGLLSSAAAGMFTAGFLILYSSSLFIGTMYVGRISGHNRPGIVVRACFIESSRVVSLK